MSSRTSAPESAADQRRLPRHHGNSAAGRTGIHCHRRNRNASGAILSETAAHRYWPGGNAVGQRFAFNNDSAPWIEIIGIVGAIHNQSLDRDPTPDVYMPYRENPYLSAPTAMSLVLRTVQNEATLAPPIRSMVSSMDPTLPVSHVRPMEAYVAHSSSPRRFNVVLLGAFAAIAFCWQQRDSMA